MKRALRKPAAILSASLFLVAAGGSFTAAYALGTQNHTVNNIRHGCPFDPGCTGATNYYGDYIRNGYNRCDASCPGDNDMDTSYTAVYYEPLNGFRGSNSCNNCFRVDVYYDTNPTAECYHSTSHSTTGPALSSHRHYTESADTAGCPL